MPDFQPRPAHFRVWDGERMHAPGEGRFVITSGGGVAELPPHTDAFGPLVVRFEPRPDLVPLFSTGFHDADGAEVFEGDVLALEFPDGDADRWIVTLGEYFHDGTPACGWHGRPVGDADSSPALTSGMRQWYYRVIGNVFENPGLLE